MKQTFIDYSAAIHSENMNTLLNKSGATIVSTEKQKRNGTIAILFKNGRVITICKSGIMRTGTLSSANKSRFGLPNKNGYSYYDYPLNRSKSDDGTYSDFYKTYPNHIMYLLNMWVKGVKFLTEEFKLIPCRDARAYGGTPKGR